MSVEADTTLVLTALATARSVSRAVEQDRHAGAGTKALAPIYNEQHDEAVAAVKRLEQRAKL